ncbi:DUF4158 domain-containing protein [Cupriavidus basilensis]|uniref:DUF4158 domain-containing protein n=1 Tax=Cupriavidus basilensis TaxID=68895 RepID=UPI0039F6E98F
MPGLGFRYVGSDRLPIRLSEFDVERYFALTDSDVAAMNVRFRHDRRAWAAIQLVFLRASGHSLGQVSTLPRQLLHYIGQRLGLLTPTIASDPISAVQDALRPPDLGLRVFGLEVNRPGPVGRPRSMDAPGCTPPRARRTE